MSEPAYSLEALRRYRENRDQKPTLADIPADAEMDEGIVLGCWNGKRFVSWEKWRAASPIETGPIEREQE